MYKSNTIEPSELINRLERKFQRKIQASAERSEARRLRNHLSNFRGIDWDLIYEDIVPATR